MYSHEEYADMIYMYGFVNGDASEARREYGIRFLNRNIPDRRTIQSAFDQLRRTGSTNNNPRPGAAGGDINANEDPILDVVRNDPTTSSRRIGLQLAISHVSVHRTLVRNNIHPYHLTKVQDLLHADLEIRIILCRQVHIIFCMYASTRGSVRISLASTPSVSGSIPGCEIKKFCGWYLQGPLSLVRK